MLKFICTRCRRLSSNTRPTPWFVDEPFSSRPQPPHLPPTGAPLPNNVPDTLKELHSQLVQSPYLEAGTLLVSEPIPIYTRPSESLPLILPKGRRRRGGTYAGEGFLEPPGGIWKWVVMAQVKEGTEKRGGIESVVRIVRKTLLSSGLALPPNSKRREHNGWAMVDAGDFAVHVLSSEVRDRYFGRLP